MAIPKNLRRKNQSVKLKRNIPFNAVRENFAITVIFETYLVILKCLDLEVGDAGDWPLEWFCDQLSQDLFSTSWETRHGAATAIREILTVHGQGAGRATYLSAEQVILL